MASKKKTKTPKPTAPEETVETAKTAEAPEPTRRVEPAQDGASPKKGKGKKAKAEKPKKASALDAAAKVLAEAGEPMSTQEMIDAMTAAKYWTSPNGLTPAATLYSAILRELKTKGDQARFKKTARGQFALV